MQGEENRLFFAYPFDEVVGQLRYNRNKQVRKGMAMSVDWTRLEVEAIVADYLHMLKQELSGQSYNKTAHRKALQQKLNARSDASIERKHMNISAIMLELGCPYITGYKPYGNYQQLLYDVVSDQVIRDEQFDRAAMHAVNQPAIEKSGIDFSDIFVLPPTHDLTAAEPRAQYVTKHTGVKLDYLDREARNRSLGLAGEKFVVELEHARLIQQQRPDLAKKIDHVSQSAGDGMGFDILSYDVDGKEKYIEVKTTSFGSLTPFFISKHEVDFSDCHQQDYSLFRVFDFRKKTRVFTLDGSVKQHCLLDPTTFLARFG